MKGKRQVQITRSLPDRTNSVTEAELDFPQVEQLLSEFDITFVVTSRSGAKFMVAGGPRFVISSQQPEENWKDLPNPQAGLHGEEEVVIGGQSSPLPVRFLFNRGDAAEILASLF